MSTCEFNIGGYNCGRLDPNNQLEKKKLASMFSGSTTVALTERLKKVMIDWGRRTYKIDAKYECYIN